MMKMHIGKAGKALAFLHGVSEGVLAAYTVFTPKPIKRRRDNPWEKVGLYLLFAMDKVPSSDANELDSYAFFTSGVKDGGILDEEEKILNNKKEEVSILSRW